MEIVTDPAASVPPADGSAVTIGAYDGVHIGHQALLADLRTRAEKRGLATVVVTFDRHPATVVRPDSAPLLLCDLAQKLELLANAGVDRTVVVPFDMERANESAEDFVSEILVGAVASKLIVVGEDFHFGHGRKGNVALLKEMGVDAGFAVEGMSLATDSGAGPEAVPISSTRIRSLVAEGRMAEAATLLGRPHQVRGTVVHGDARGGADLGFPTANVEVPPGIAIPAVGIYAGWYERPDGTRWAAAISVGTRPTFYADQGPLIVEAFLLDFEGDLYGEEARVSFVAQVRRDELRFDSVDDLVAQMHRDVDATRIALAGG
ncbi:MAG: riboflavin kinase / adenylyltransferase [Acidimicrobiaceae bacterium]|nr:riboflavin kinase / adenylyltransferase [Acidimicrobiaceae bacterium]